MNGEHKSPCECGQIRFAHSLHQVSIYENLDGSSEKLNKRDSGHTKGKDREGRFSLSLSASMFAFNESHHQTSMPRRLRAACAGEEDIDGILAITEPRGRPNESLVGRVREDFAFRGKAIGVGFNHRHRDPFVRIESFDLFDRNDRRPMIEKAHLRPPKRAGLLRDVKVRGQTCRCCIED
jgi:hypothetical protein